MKETPILFSGEMVRAILDGRKTQTRRICKPRFDGRTPCEHFEPVVVNGQYYMMRHCNHGSECRPCPYGVVGDRLWVRETWAKCAGHTDCGGIYFRADVADNIGAKVDRWRPSIYMPRHASRITLKITWVRVERLQEITEADAWAEGVTREAAGAEAPTGRDCFEMLWDSINANRGYGWAVNPWVWVVEFKRV
jgi:hypothetical protein